MAFRDIHHIFIYLIGDLAFLPLEVLLVVLVIERILARRERQAVLRKLNMVVGAFFIEIGNDLLRDLLTYFNNRDEVSEHLDVGQNWTRTDYGKAAAFAQHLRAEVDMHRIDLEQLKALLTRKRTFMLMLLENPNLLEHERFTDLLWAATHLDEELEARPSVKAECA